MLPDDPNEQARLLYLVILGAVIAVYFLRQSRHRLGQTAQQAAIWGLIFLAAIVAYGFRDTLSAQLFPRRAVVVDETTIALRRAADEHFYANLKINGKTIEFVVDTGATEIVLSDRDARRIGLDPDKLEFLGIARTANGTVRTAAVTLDRVEFGDWTDFDVRAQVNGGPLSGSLLGMSYLSLFSRIEIEGDRLLLIR